MNARTGSGDDASLRVKSADWDRIAAELDARGSAVRHRPVRGTRGAYRVNLRHGVSRIRAGNRHALGVIFHDAL